MTHGLKVIRKLCAGLRTILEKEAAEDLNTEAGSQEVSSGCILLLYNSVIG